ncbi:G protein-regulated inducer of neurite outgrowth 2-like [Arapaima gigas]
MLMIIYSQGVAFSPSLEISLALLTAVPRMSTGIREHQQAPTTRMAESEHPTSKVLSLGDPAGPTPDNNTTFPLSTSSTEVTTSIEKQEKLQKSTGGTVGPYGPYEKLVEDNQQRGYHLSRAVTPETAVRHNALRPHSIAEAHGLQWVRVDGPRGARNHHYSDMGCGLASKDIHAGSSSHRDLREDQLEVIKQSVQRSHSDSLQALREAQATRHGEVGFPCPGVGFCPTLVCKQAMQLQQSTTITTCHSNNSNSPTPNLRSVQICVPNTEDGHTQHLGCMEACYGPHIPACGLEDTFAAYCHPLPIPTPSQLLPKLGNTENRHLRTPPNADLLPFPRLVSSISETGLDAKRVTCCCVADCLEQASPHATEGRKTRDTGTMTSHGELREVGVQTGHPESPLLHVFPEVSLAMEEAGPVTQKSPVKEVAWDAEGMTWEVYGASVDPEELGLAIQKHLELQIKETANRTAKLNRQDTGSSRQSSRRHKRGSLMGSLRNPACCASTAVD